MVPADTPDVRQRLETVLGLTGSFLVAEALGGAFTGSLALLADAGHTLTDVGALALTLLALRFGARSPTDRMTYGYRRLEVLAALVNSVVLLFVSALILYEACQRALRPPAVLSGPMLVVAFAGLAVSLISFRLLLGTPGHSLNVRAARLEVLSDSLGSAGAVVAGAVMLTTGWYLADPLISAGIALLILPRTWKLLREVGTILMEGTPESVDRKGIGDAIRAAEGVRGVHRLHLWTLTPGFVLLTAHVDVEDTARPESILPALRRMLKERFGIEHSTIQLETAKVSADAGCASCPEHGNAADRKPE